VHYRAINDISLAVRVRLKLILVVWISAITIYVALIIYNRFAILTVFYFIAYYFFVIYVQLQRQNFKLVNNYKYSNSMFLVSANYSKVLVSVADCSRINSTELAQLEPSSRQIVMLVGWKCASSCHCVFSSCGWGNVGTIKR